MKTFKEHLEENPDVTLLSLSWSFYWRLALIFISIGFLTALVGF